MGGMSQRTILPFQLWSPSFQQSIQQHPTWPSWPSADRYKVALGLRQLSPGIKFNRPVLRISWVELVDLSSDFPGIYIAIRPVLGFAEQRKCPGLLGAKPCQEKSSCVTDALLTEISNEGHGGRGPPTWSGRRPQALSSSYNCVCVAPRWWCAKLWWATGGWVRACAFLELPRSERSKGKKSLRVWFEQDIHWTRVTV